MVFLKTLNMGYNRELLQLKIEESNPIDITKEVMVRSTRLTRISLNGLDTLKNSDVNKQIMIYARSTK